VEHIKDILQEEVRPPSPSRAYVASSNVGADTIAREEHIQPESRHVIRYLQAITTYLIADRSDSLFILSIRPASLLSSSPLLVVTYSPFGDVSSEVSRYPARSILDIDVDAALAGRTGYKPVLGGAKADGGAGMSASGRLKRR
jgi:hypothetical protein